MAISFAEAVHALLSGKALAWKKFREHKAGSIALSTPAQRRLLAYLLNQEAAKVAQGNEELFAGLIAAWSAKHDPASGQSDLPAATNLEMWRLDRIEAAGFGGLTLFGGENFEFWIEGNNWCLLGQNGSGKTSLASAIMWALTGKRIREQDGPIDENGERAPVHAPDGKKIGDWPPVASYPASANELSKAVEVWVRLTFKNSKGELATALRRMICNPNGTATTERQIDPRLLSCPQLIETGLLMPARLVRIGFGDKSQSLYDAVKLLTGLDQLSDIADGCSNFTHAGRRFLKFGKDNGIDGFATRFEENIERGTAKAKELSFVLPADFKISDTDIVKSLRDVAESASSDAAAHLESLKSEIDSKIDISTQESRARIRAAVNAARGILSQPVTGTVPFGAWAALKEASDSPQFGQLPNEVTNARTALNTALGWHARQNADHKFRLKALAAHYFVPPHTHEEAAHCPLCEGALATEQQRELAFQLEELRKDAVEAERKLEEVCLSIGAKLAAHIPPALGHQLDVLKDMNPRDAYLAGTRQRFCLAAPFKETLSGLSAEIELLTTAQHTELPQFEYQDFQPSGDEPSPATALRQRIHDYERLAALAAWWVKHRQVFRDALAALMGQPQADGSFPPTSIEAHLARIEQALLKSEPLDELSKFLTAAASAAEAWIPINAEQKRREQIAGALEPLKDLRILVGAETASSIDRLSDRIKAILKRIHYQERLTYEQTSIAKKAVTVDGSFEVGMQIDAAHVANSSWLRAILWAFVLALREETVAALGKNPFPLMVLDDPQITFDPRNKLKWAEEIARLANLDETAADSAQLFLTTHERYFYQCMVDHQALKGQQGLIGGVNKASGVAKIVNGGCLERVFNEANANNDDVRARDYISDVRIYCEDLLKCVLRGESPGIPGFTLDKLAKELKRLKEARTPPFDRTPFKKLLDTLTGGGGKEIKLINESHHKDDETIGLAQANDVNLFWEKTLRTQIHDVFELYDNFSSFYGEPRSFPWAKNVVPFPVGSREAVKAAVLQHTGVAAAARTDGIAGDGIVTVEEWDSGTPIVLANHEAYQLAAGTLDPVASIGDLVIVCNHAPVHPRNLVVARIGDALLARRFNTVEAHPEIAVLTGQSVDPTVLAEPMLIAPTTENCRKVVGTVFTARTLGAPAADPNREIVPLSDPTIVSSLLNGTRLFQVKGRSAEPIALDGQFLITRSSAPKPAELKALDGRLIVAVDENGARYFKRLRYGTQLMILESLNPDGTTAAEVLSSDGALGFPKLTHALEVIGVLFELPTS